MKRPNRKELGTNMKTKNKVTTFAVVCLSLLFVFVCGISITNGTKKTSQAIEVASDSNEGAEVAIASTDVPEEEFVTATPDNQEEEQEIALFEEDGESESEIFAAAYTDEIRAVVEETVNLTLEDTIVATLSLSDPEFTFDKVLPRVSESLNIRSEAKADAEVVGKLYKNSYGVILERGEAWTKIKSGDVVGYASNDYLYFDDDAITVAKSLDAFKVVITAGTVNIRTKPTTDSDILDKANSSDTFTHIPEMDTEEWYAVRHDANTLAYISKDYAEEKFTLKTAVSKAKEEEEKKAAEYAKALQEAKKYTPSSTNRKAVTVSDEDMYLLATVVAMEALSEPYEGKLAVANVVVNRMLDGYWGSSIPAVVYAKGQFSGANSGRVERFSSKVTEDCKRAAVEALAGNNNIGSYMFFIMKGKASYSSYKKYYILGNHCFYSR